MTATLPLAPPSLPNKILVVNLTTPSTPITTILAVQTCVGLFNRDAHVASTGVAAYSIMHEPFDTIWLSEAVGDGSFPALAGAVPTPTSVAAFLSRCLSPGGPAAGYIRYNYTAQQALVPNIITAAGTLDAVPLEDGSPFVPPNATKVWDAVVSLRGMAAVDATAFVYDRWGNVTSTMAFMDPGYQGANKDPFHPTLTGSPDLSLVDYIVKTRMFNFYMVEACVPFTPQNALMSRMASDTTGNSWPRPIAVYGYDDTFPIAGDLFEAETGCAKEHNMGQVASTGVNNLAFFSLAPTISTPLPQNPAPVPAAYNSSKTYISFTVGDGDNILYLKTTRRQWMEQRVAQCAKRQEPSGRGCFPLLWSLSPHPLEAAPLWMRWYYEQANTTGQDYFVLPPSGALYAYPAMMPSDVQEAFVNRTEYFARMLSTSASVDWEFTGSWDSAIANYFPRYDTNNVVNSFYAVNVPFMFPVWAFGENEFFKVLGKNRRVVLFRPREWRGDNPKGAPIFSGKEYLTSQQMADEVNGYPAGTVTQIYLTSDGGFNLPMLFDMVDLLGAHVEVVNHQALSAMALAADAAAPAT